MAKLKKQIQEEGHKKDNKGGKGKGGGQCPYSRFLLEAPALLMETREGLVLMPWPPPPLLEARCSSLVMET